MDKKTKNGIIRNANFMSVTLLKTEVEFQSKIKVYQVINLYFLTELKQVLQIC